MNILSELRSLKLQVAELEKNQKEKQAEPTGRLSSGGYISEYPASQRIEYLMYEVEQLMVKVIDLQETVINSRNDNY